MFWEFLNTKPPTMINWVALGYQSAYALSIGQTEQDVGIES